MIKMYTQIGSLLFAVVLGAKRAVELRPHATVASGFLTHTMVCALGSPVPVGMNLCDAPGLRLWIVRLEKTGQNVGRSSPRLLYAV